MILIVSYHYIGAEDAWPNGGIYPVSPERFRRQLALIGESFEFIGPRDLIKGVAREKPLPPRACLITFDDGLSQQFDLALPILDEIGAPAAFYVCGQPLSTGVALDVHRFHLILARLSMEGTRKAFDQYCQENLGGPLNDILVDAPNTVHKLGDNFTKRLKYNFYHVFSQERRDSLLDHAFKLIGVEQRDFSRNLYMDHQRLKELAARGYLGLHTETHKPLSGLDEQAVIQELSSNLAALERAAGRPLGEIGISYPYGRPAFVNETTLRAVRKFSLRYGLTTIRGLNHLGGNEFWLRRMDTNDVPGGKSPAFDFNNLEQAPYEPF